MKNRDLTALLKKNPGVDQRVLEESGRALQEAKKLLGKKTEQPVVSPYGGRRMISDDSGKQKAFGLDGDRPSYRF